MTSTYAEGDWFALPLRGSQRYAVGRVVRIAPKGRIIVAYFFHRVWDAIPMMADLEHLTPSDAVLKAECGDLGLHQWHVASAGFDSAVRSQQVADACIREKTALGTEYLRVEYPSDSPGTKPRETSISEDEARTLPEYGMAGAGYIELKLTQLLGASPE